MTLRDVGKELTDDGLHHVAVMRAGGHCTSICRYRHEAGHYHVYIEHDIEKFVVYALIVGDEIIKCGRAGSKGGTLIDRMRNTVNSGNGAWLFAEGRPIGSARWQHRPLDKYKQLIPSVIRSGQEIEVWAGAFTASTLEAKERELNGKYNPPWVDRNGHTYFVGLSCSVGSRRFSPFLSRRQTKCRLAKARPEPDFRYRSKATALSTRVNSSDTTSCQGLSRRVWTDPPELWVSSRVLTHDVSPT